MRKRSQEFNAILRRPLKLAAQRRANAKVAAGLLIAQRDRGGQA